MEIIKYEKPSQKKLNVSPSILEDKKRKDKKRQDKKEKG